MFQVLRILLSCPWIFLTPFSSDRCALPLIMAWMTVLWFTLFINHFKLIFLSLFFALCFCGFIDACVSRGCICHQNSHDFFFFLGVVACPGKLGSIKIVIVSFKTNSVWKNVWKGFMIFVWPAVSCFGEGECHRVAVFLNTDIEGLNPAWSFWCMSKWMELNGKKIVYKTLTFKVSYYRH